jgi:hypothetical protein
MTVIIHGNHWCERCERPTPCQKDDVCACEACGEIKDGDHE